MTCVAVQGTKNLYSICEKDMSIGTVVVAYNQYLKAVYIRDLNLKIKDSAVCKRILASFLEYLCVTYRTNVVRYSMDGKMDLLFESLGGTDKGDGFIEIRRRNLNVPSKQYSGKKLNSRVCFKNFDGTALDLKNFVESHYMEIDFEAYIVGSTYYIIANNNIVGLISYTLQSNKAPYSLYIDCIEIFDEYRRQGLGIEVIKLLFEKSSRHPIYQNIYGESKPDAFEFWKTVGANFQMSDKKLDEYYEDGYSACFVLNRRKFISLFA